MPRSHVRHPAQVNQFFRIVIDSHGVPRKGTRWNDVVNGHNFDSENCMAAEGAVAASAHTDLVRVYSPNRIRAAQTDFNGGIGVDDVDDAFRQLAIGELVHPANFSWADVIQALIDRRHVAIAVDYRKVPPSAKLQTPGNFDHALGLDDWDDGWILKYDSLGLAPVWVREADVRPAAEAIALRERGNRNALYAGVTRVRQALPTGRWAVSVQLDGNEVKHPYGLYTVSNGVVATSTVAYTRGFSASSTAPATYRWPGGHTAQRLVRVTSGYRKGFYIRAAYAEQVA